MKPSAKNHNPDPKYIRSLIEKAGLSHQSAARAVGISSRMMRYYVAEVGNRPAPYAIQYALEQLAITPGSATRQP